MVVNYQELKGAIIGNKYSIFMIEFAEVKTKIDNFIAQPSPASEKIAVVSIFDYPNSEEKLKLIYGNDAVIDKKIPNFGYSMSNKIVRIPIAEWDNWFKENATITLDHQIRFMNTYVYNDHVVCSMIINTRTFS